MVTNGTFGDAESGDDGLVGLAFEPGHFDGHDFLLGQFPRDLLQADGKA